MRHRALRACLSIVLVFTLLGMLPLQAAMAVAMDSTTGMPMKMSGAMHGAAHEATDNLRSEHHTDPVVSHLDPTDTHQRTPCPCDGHCGLCGACFSVLSSVTAYTLVATGLSITQEHLANLTDIPSSPDPRPPRA